MWTRPCALYEEKLSCDFFGIPSHLAVWVTWSHCYSLLNCWWPFRGQWVDTGIYISLPLRGRTMAWGTISGDPGRGPHFDASRNSLEKPRTGVETGQASLMLRATRLSLLGPLQHSHEVHHCIFDPWRSFGLNRNAPFLLYLVFAAGLDIGISRQAIFPHDWGGACFRTYESIVHIIMLASF